MTRLETRGTDRARWTAFATAVVIIAGSVLAAAQPAFASGPAVTAISPTSGLPGVVVGVTGTGFLGGCTSSSPTVFIGITQVNVLAGASDTLVHFQVPVMRDGFYDVQVQDCAGAVSPPVAADLFTLVLPARPKVTSVAPKTGTIGTTLTVTGTSFRLYCTDGRIPSVTFDDPNVFGDEVVVQDGGPEIVSWTDTKIVVHAPAHPASLLDILPRDCVGRQSIPSAADQFTYLAPKITSVAPTSGTAGTLVTVKGTGFRNGCTTGGPTLIIGGTGMPAGSAGVQSMTAVQIVVHVPPHLAGAVPVQVRDCAGDVSAVVTASKFTYLAPKVSSLAPTTGTIGTTVTVTGTGFM
ncbi:MAG: mucin9, partial [Pseudonocardiales bacterium]|nr:mucin9 [Pseudonocardiales bacterium]